MRYYLVAGEASGDLHASLLMRALRERDHEAQFRCFGGDLMAQEGGTLVKHYRELAYMGFIPVLLHLKTILKGMELCKHDIAEWHPDAVILVDYPGFNLDIAKYVHQRRLCPVYYYIAPKIWAWKEYRIRRIRRDVDEMFSILPFEVAYFEQKHHYPIHYVGNPTAQEVREWLSTAHPSPLAHQASARPVIALLAGSRRQEIRDNLPAMIEATRHLADRYQVVLAGAPSIDEAYYEPYIKGTHVSLVMNQTYQLLAQSTAALVTSGTATLETCMFGVPQVVCYFTRMKHLVGILRRLVLQVKYVSLVNLIANGKVVTELVAESFSVDNIRRELEQILPGGSRRQQMLSDYEDIKDRLGQSDAPSQAAELMTELLRSRLQKVPLDD